MFKTTNNNKIYPLLFFTVRVVCGVFHSCVHNGLSVARCLDRMWAGWRLVAVDLVVSESKYI